MTPENQSETPNPKPTEEEVRKAEDIVIDSELGVHDVDSGMIYDTQKIINGIAQALAEQRQSWEKEKYDLLTYGANQAESIASLENELRKAEGAIRTHADSINALMKEKAGLEERVRTLDNELTHLKKLEDLDAEAIKVYYAPIYAKKQKIFNLELTRLKAENERLEARYDRDAKAFCESENENVQLRDRISRLTSALGATMEIIRKILKQCPRVAVDHACIECTPAGSSVVEGFLCGVHEGVKALSDPTGQLAFEKWKAMEAVVSAAMNVLAECEKEADANETYASVMLKVLDMRDALEALDAKG